MKIFISKITERLRAWTLRWAHTPHMAVALFLIAFTESSFFPIPPDFLMIAILMINAKRWRRYALIATVGSVLGAVLGYAVGWGFYETVGSRIADAYHLNTAIQLIGSKFEQHAFLTIFTAAFTLIPFKVFTISAGLFKISIWQMLIASIIGRGMRFFIIAWLIHRFGKRLNHLIFKYFNILSVSFVLLLVLGFIIYNFLF